jgi:hypothetical protein
MRQPARPLDLSALPTHSIRERQARLFVEDLAAAPAVDLLASMAKVGSAKRLTETAREVREAARRGRTVVALVGREVLAAGCSTLASVMMERGLLSAVALDGAAALSDFELACYGQTDEDPASPHYGAWREVGETFNQIIAEGVSRGYGLGEFLGRSLLERSPRNVGLSILARGAAKRIPVTVHPRAGADPVQRFATADPGSLGKGAQRDFLLLAGQLPSLDGGGIILDLWAEGLHGVIEQALAAASQASSTAPTGWRYVSFYNDGAPERLPGAAMSGATVVRLCGEPFLLSLFVVGALGAGGA